MSHQYPSRRRGRSRLDDGFMAYESHEPYEPYDFYNFYEQRPPRKLNVPRERPPPRSPPRHQKSGRHRRVPSPSYYSDEPTSSSHHYHNRSSRQEPDRRDRSTGPDRRGRGRGPSLPPFPSHQDPPAQFPRSSRREGQLPSNNNRQFGNDYDQDFFVREPSPRHYPSDRQRRSSQGQHRHSHRSVRDPSPDPRLRERNPRDVGYQDAGDYNATRRRRPRSQTRGRRDHTLSGSSPVRGRPPPAERGRDSRTRRSSMPASTQPRVPWWQNPLVQAGARTALTAGAQAAMKSRDDPSPWLGPKGAKVATAALGAALVDGFIGQKHPNSVRQNIARQGLDLASGKVASSTKARHHRS